jgi:hypothetical protein
MTYSYQMEEISASSQLSLSTGKNLGKTRVIKRKVSSSLVEIKFRTCSDVAGNKYFGGP